MHIRQFFSELKRRKVYRVIVTYGITAWLLAQVASLVLSSFEAPAWIMKATIILLMAGFPVALILAWIFEVSPEGTFQKTNFPDDISDPERTSRMALARVSLIAVILLSAAGVYFLLTITPLEIQGNRASENSVAVLPFTDMSPDQSQLYLGQGISESITNLLGRIGALKVIGRTSSFLYEKSEKDLKTIGEELGVRMIVQGSIQKMGDRLRIGVQIIDASDGSQAWSYQEERVMDDIFSVQDEIAEQVLLKISERSGTSEIVRHFDTEKVDPEVYEAYLKGKFHWYLHTPRDFELSQQYHRKAIALDSTFAPAYVGLADAIGTPAHDGLAPMEESFREARALLKKALELDPNLPEAHDMNARILFALDWKYEEAEEGFKKTIELDPNHVDVRCVYTQYLRMFARFEEAEEQARIGMEMEPQFFWPKFELAMLYASMYRYDDALNFILDPAIRDAPAPANTIGILYALQSKYKESINQMIRVANMTGDTIMANMLNENFEQIGFLSTMKKVAMEMEKRSETVYIGPLIIAHYYALAQDVENTLFWLERAVDSHASSLVYVVSNPIYTFVRGEKRYLSVLSKMNLPYDPYRDIRSND